MPLLCLSGVSEQSSLREKLSPGVTSDSIKQFSLLERFLGDGRF
jgi:hypothetical protein